jgi:hypothetical protein
MRKMKKSEILLRLKEITEVMESRMMTAKDESTKYSTDTTSQLAFEVGYLSGVVKSVVSELKDIK